MFLIEFIDKPTVYVSGQRDNGLRRSLEMMVRRRASLDFGACDRRPRHQPSFSQQPNAVLGFPVCPTERLDLATMRVRQKKQFCGSSPPDM